MIRFFFLNVMASYYPMYVLKIINNAQAKHHKLKLLFTSLTISSTLDFITQNLYRKTIISFITWKHILKRFHNLLTFIIFIFITKVSKRKLSQKTNITSIVSCDAKNGLCVFNTPRYWIHQVYNRAILQVAIMCYVVQLQEHTLSSKMLHFEFLFRQGLHASLVFQFVACNTDAATWYLILPPGFGSIIS